MSFDAIGIVSENPQRSIEFYGILGVELKQYENSGHFEGKTPSGVRFMLDTADVIRSFEPGWKKTRGNGISLCFLQSSARGVDEVFAKLQKAGFEIVKAPWDAFWGHRYACVKDPDGIQIDLFAPL